MKQLLQTIWNFVRKIPKKITKYIRHNNHNRNGDEPSPIEEQVETSSLKYKRKRRSFKSFMDLEEHAVKGKRRKSSRRKQKRKEGNRGVDMSIFSKIMRGNKNSQLEASSSRMQSHDNNFIKIHSQVECEAIFQDTNGVEISMIGQGIIRDENQFKESDSEIQLIKLISGDKIEENQKLLTQKFEQINFEDGFKKREKLQWWQKIVEGKAPSYNIRRQRQQVENNNARQKPNLANSQSNFQALYQQTNKKQPTVTRQRDRSQTIKVLNLIDLVFDQDFPRLYQVPLAVKVYD